MASCKTVKVKNEKSESGFCFINESDFVEGEHELYDAPPKRRGRKAKTDENKTA